MAAVDVLIELRDDTSRRLDALKKEQAGLNSQVSVYSKRLAAINAAIRELTPVP